MAFLTEPEPPRGIATPSLPGVRRIVAKNPSLMTYHGTNTYLIDTPEGTVVLDPGPDDAAHVDAILAAAADVALIVLTHTHSDHMGAVKALKSRTGAPVAGWHASGIAAFEPDTALHDGQAIAGLTGLFTPGHAPDHLCFSFIASDGTRALFSGDHVMSWSSSIVNPPQGDMAAYFASLRRVIDRDEDAVYLPGHGPLLANPRKLARDLLLHRQTREQAIVDAIAGRPPTGTRALTDALYSQTHPMLRMAAERNVLAHLLKLEAEGVARRAEGLWVAA